jgi:hypothetical protein
VTFRSNSNMGDKKVELIWETRGKIGKEERAKG